MSWIYETEVIERMNDILNTIKEIKRRELDLKTIYCTKYYPSISSGGIDYQEKVEKIKELLSIIDQFLNEDIKRLETIKDSLKEVDNLKKLAMQIIE